jgi:hypothetical protein
MPGQFVTNTRSNVVPVCSMLKPCTALRRAIVAGFILVVATNAFAQDMSISLSCNYTLQRDPSPGVIPLMTEMTAQVHLYPTSATVQSVGYSACEILTGNASDIKINVGCEYLVNNITYRLQLIVDRIDGSMQEHLFENGVENDTWIGFCHNVTPVF